MPAVTLTDHGSLAGAVELYREAGKQGIKPIIGCEVYVADDRRLLERGFAHLTLLAETNEGYANLIKLVSTGFLEGYYYKPRVDWELLERALGRDHRALRLHVRPGLEGARGRKPKRRGRGARAPARRLRRRLDLRRAAERGHRGAGGSVPRPRGPRRGARAAARRDRRRPLPAPRGRPGARGAPLHPVGRHALEPGPLALRDRPVLLQEPGGDGARLPGLSGGARAHARDRRALLGHDGAGRDPAPHVPDAGRPRRLRLPRRAVREGPRPPLRPGHARASGAPALRAEDDQGDGLRRLLPDRLGLHPVREARGDRRGAGPRLGGRLARRLLARGHRHRPDPLRPPVRAVPEPGPQVDAGHRHRLLRPRPRPGHQLRARQVRQRPRRPDHHLRDDDGARRRARRGPRARRARTARSTASRSSSPRARRSTSRSR